MLVQALARAASARWRRVVNPSLSKVWLRWLFTVAVDTNIRAPISSLVRPSTTSSATLRSVGVKLAHPDLGRACEALASSAGSRASSNQRRASTMSPRRTAASAKMHRMRAPVTGRKGSANATAFPGAGTPPVPDRERELEHPASRRCPQGSRHRGCGLQARVLVRGPRRPKGRNGTRPRCRDTSARPPRKTGRRGPRQLHQEPAAATARSSSPTSRAAAATCITAQAMLQVSPTCSAVRSACSAQ